MRKKPTSDREGSYAILPLRGHTTMPRKKKPIGRPPKLIPPIPDTFENILKAVVKPRPRKPTP